ncbi:hypothetical protein B4U79_08975 [Dinothrombium tinctorium]|uniref:Uncharacterized protein n=1 Tax=Dinothrombium tinctorium TaxID=1965070 RepID=A0A3S3P190_9ACAR|nr:hypothetical protein B4U79_03610 [Dinothrombium tinctorium]RWS11197.1 hypothetical protein B4U79_08975 [Dinothrombium tinctorium]
MSYVTTQGFSQIVKRIIRQ